MMKKPKSRHMTMSQSRCFPANIKKASTRQGLKLSSLTGSTYLLPGTYTKAAIRQVHPIHTSYLLGGI